MGDFAPGFFMGQGMQLRSHDRDDSRSIRRFVVSSDSLYPLPISFNLEVKPKQWIDRLVIVYGSNNREPLAEGLERIVELQ
jgi:hypothetical protein